MLDILSSVNVVTTPNTAAATAKPPSSFFCTVRFLSLRMSRFSFGFRQRGVVLPAALLLPAVLRSRGGSGRGGEVLGLHLRGTHDALGVEDQQQAPVELVGTDDQLASHAGECLRRCLEPGIVDLGHLADLVDEQAYRLLPRAHNDV